MIDIPTKTPYVCGCIKEIWLLLQLLVERFTENAQHTQSFWTYFNKALNWHREMKSNFFLFRKIINVEFHHHHQLIN